MMGKGRHGGKLGNIRTHICIKRFVFLEVRLHEFTTKNKNYANENYEVLLPFFLTCLLVWMSFLLLFSVFFFFLENKTNTRAMELGG